MVVANDVWKASKTVLKYTNPLGWLATEAAEMAISKSTEIIKNGTIQELEKEARRQEVAARIAEAQAKVAQELAIARRIDTAEEVTIEEYYDLSGKGEIGANINGESISVGLTGQGRRVTKRVYIFKGYIDGVLVAPDNTQNLDNPEKIEV